MSEQFFDPSEWTPEVSDREDVTYIGDPENVYAPTTSELSIEEQQ